MKAPPLDPANPTPAHQYLPQPAASARLKAANTHNTNSQGMITPDDEHNSGPAASQQHTGARFPATENKLSEQQLDNYFVNFEAASKELEILLTGPIEKVNKRSLTHLSQLSTEYSELGARLNGFSLSEPNASLSAAIERVGQAADTTYLATEELANSLGATFAEPMRESAQFAGVVRSVLKYRVLKRVQQEMVVDELAKKRAQLEQLERSEAEAHRIEQYLASGGRPSENIRRSTSSGRRQSYNDGQQNTRPRTHEDNASIDSDFPPTHDRAHGSPPPSAQQGVAPAEEHSPPAKKASAGNFITNKIFGRISHAVHGLADTDPEKSRRDAIGKTRESIEHLEQAQIAVAKDVKDASEGVLKDLKRFQGEKEDDLKRYMVSTRTNMCQSG